MRRIVTLATVLVLCTALSACGSSRPRSPKALRQSIVAAALAQTSVHWSEHVEGLVDSASTVDVSANSGKGRYTFQNLGGPRGILWIRRLHRVVYVRGNATALVGILNVSRAKAKNYVGQWISIPRGDKLYAKTANRLKLATVVHDDIPFWALNVLRTTSNGQQRRLVLSTGRRMGFKASLTADANGPPLPITSSSNDMNNEGHSRYSRWNEPVHVRAPASSTPIAIVRGAPNGVLRSIVAAGLAQKSVHMTATVFAGLIGKIGYAVDVSRDSVSERITYRGLTMRVLVFDHAVYLRAAALLLRERLGLTPEQARRYAGQWIWIPQAGGEHKLYADLTTGLRFSSIIRRATRMTNVKLSPGTAFLVVRGTPALQRLPVDELKARANGTPLPVAFSGRLPGAWTRGRFSKWNEPVKILLPESSTPIAIVRGS